LSALSTGHRPGWLRYRQVPTWNTGRSVGCRTGHILRPPLKAGDWARSPDHKVTLDSISPVPADTAGDIQSCIAPVHGGYVSGKYKSF
jgi:hypothetical protein